MCDKSFFKAILNFCSGITWVIKIWRKKGQGENGVVSAASGWHSDALLEVLHVWGGHELPSSTGATVIQALSEKYQTHIPERPGQALI